MLQLFALLSSGLGTVHPSFASANLFCTMAQEDWQELRSMADNQGVSAIALDGMNLLINTLGKEKVVSGNIDAGWWQQFVYEWIGTTTQIEQKNKV